jgi:hypothetical protein
MCAAVACVAVLTGCGSSGGGLASPVGTGAAAGASASASASASPSGPPRPLDPKTFVLTAADMPTGYKAFSDQMDTSSDDDNTCEGTLNHNSTQVANGSSFIAADGGMAIENQAEIDSASDVDHDIKALGDQAGRQRFLDCGRKELAGDLGDGVTFSSIDLIDVSIVPNAVVGARVVGINEDGSRLYLDIFALAKGRVEQTLLAVAPSGGLPDTGVETTLARSLSAKLQNQ